MPDYLVSKLFIPNVSNVEPIPFRAAIEALRAENVRLEQSMPRPHSVPAFILGITAVSQPTTPDKI